MVIKIKNYRLKNKIRSYLRELVNDLKQYHTWKIQLTITINFISSKDDNGEDCVMFSKIDNMECDCNWTQTQNHLILKRTLNHLAN